MVSTFCHAWLLGSQACEQTFRAARSMTGTFSTVINFTLLDFLHHLHRLQIQLEPESETQETGIEHPRVMAHTKKVGYEALKEITDLKYISDEDIITTINQANSEAARAIRELGMAFTNKELENAISRPLSETIGCDNDDDVDDDDDSNGDSDGDNAKVDHDKKDIVHNKDLLKDISVMQKIGAIDDNFCNVSRKTFECTDNSTVPLYIKIDCSKKQQVRKFSPFVEVSHNGKVFHIHKSTAVWLLALSGM